MNDVNTLLNTSRVHTFVQPLFNTTLQSSETNTESEPSVAILQGGCMAIEDGYELALTLSEAAKDTSFGQSMDIQGALSSYQSVSFTPLVKLVATRLL